MPKRALACAALALPLATATALAAPPLPATEQARAYQAAGVRKGPGGWRLCDIPGPGATPASLAAIGDLDGDGQPEALVTEDNGACYGATGSGYALVSRAPNGAWRLMAKGAGIVTPLATRGAGGWPDLEIGGPGFCFPVLRWNGRSYVEQRTAYEGKPCRR
jgi:hypothetical protein